jgi:hypothetical protein
MILEIVGALAIAALVLWVVFGTPGRDDVFSVIPEPDAVEETRRGIALLALKEIEFDRETGKLSDTDYLLLKERYSAEAVQALKAEEPIPTAASDPVPAPVSLAATSCPACGPRPEPGAVYCSACGRRIDVR